jgi:hypothetical protein
MSRFAARGPLTELLAAARIIGGYYRGGISIALQSLASAGVLRI